MRALLLCLLPALACRSKAAGPSDSGVDSAVNTGSVDPLDELPPGPACAPVEGSDGLRLLVAQPVRGRVAVIDPATGAAWRLDAALPNPDAGGFAVDPSTQELFFSTFHDSAVWRLPLDPPGATAQQLQRVAELGGQGVGLDRGRNEVLWGIYYGGLWSAPLPEAAPGGPRRPIDSPIEPDEVAGPPVQLLAPADLLAALVALPISRPLVPIDSPIEPDPDPNDVGIGDGVDLADDGDTVVFLTRSNSYPMNRALMRWDRSAGTLTALTRLESECMVADFAGGRAWVSTTPDGQPAAGGDYAATLWSVPLDGAPPTRHTELPGHCGGMAHDPLTGQLYGAEASGVVWTASPDGGSVEELVRLTSTLSRIAALRCPG